MIRVPKELAERLDRIGAEMLQSHIEGRSQLPSEHCEKVPHYYVIAKACDEYEDKKNRSRRSKSKKYEAIQPETAKLIEEFNRNGL